MSATEDDNEDMYAIESVDQYVDLICELSPYRPVLEQVLGYLSARDLCRIPCVCKTWKSLLCETYAKSEANRRRVRHLKRVRKLRKSVGQENWPIKGRTPVATRSRTALSDIRNVYRTIKPTKRGTGAQSFTTTTTISTPNTKHKDMGLRALR